MENKTIKKEVQVLTRALKEDEGLFMAWHANIAMSFFDEAVGQGISGVKLLEICNNTAKNFLNSLITNSGVK